MPQVPTTGLPGSSAAAGCAPPSARNPESTNECHCTRRAGLMCENERVEIRAGARHQASRYFISTQSAIVPSSLTVQAALRGWALAWMISSQYPGLSALVVTIAPSSLNR